MSVRIATGGAADQTVGRAIARLVDERIASAITAQDPTLWGPAAEAGAVGALGWTEAVADARGLVRPVEALRSELRRAGVARTALLAGPGTASAAAAIAASQGHALAILGTDPDSLSTELPGAADTVLVIADAPGSGIAAEALLAAAQRTVRAAGVDAERRIVVVAVPGSALEAAATEARLHVFPAAAVHDRFSALTAAALVPAGLAGADLRELLDEAESEELNVAIDDPSNNGLRLAAQLAAAERVEVAIVTDGTHLVGFDVWAAHLLASCGLRPTVLSPADPRLAELPVLRLVADADDLREASPHDAHGVRLSGSLGELLLVLEYAAAVTARLRGADPFSDPTTPGSTTPEGTR